MNNDNIRYGMVIGDGYLSNFPKKNSRLEITQGEKQLEYLRHKAGILKAIGIDSVIAPRKIYPNGIVSYRLTTAASPIWTQLRAEFYSFRNTPSKYRKRVTKNILKKWDLTTLLYLYLDDGHNRTTRRGIDILTMDFPYEEQELLQKWVYDLTSAEMRIYRRKSNLYLSTTKDAEIFKQALGPVFPNIECMKYKFI